MQKVHHITQSELADETAQGGTEQASPDERSPPIRLRGVLQGPRVRGLDQHFLFTLC